MYGSICICKDSAAPAHTRTYTCIHAHTGPRRHASVTTNAFARRTFCYSHTVCELCRLTNFLYFLSPHIYVIIYRISSGRSSFYRVRVVAARRSDCHTLYTNTNDHAGVTTNAVARRTFLSIELPGPIFAAVSSPISISDITSPSRSIFTERLYDTSTQTQIIKL